MVLRWIQLNECYGRGVWRGMGVTEAISDDEDGRGDFELNLTYK